MTNRAFKEKDFEEKATRKKQDVKKYFLVEKGTFKYEIILKPLSDPPYRHP